MSGLSRRAFAIGVAGAGFGVVTSGCGHSGHKRPQSQRPAAQPSSTAASPYAGDLRSVALAVAVENQAMAVYQSLDSALRTGKFSSADASLATFVQTAMAHHADHAASWGKVLRDAGQPAVTGSPLSGHAKVMASIEAAAGMDDLVAVLQGLETQAAQTYIAAVGRVSDNAIITYAATIAPVEAMHAAALSYAFAGRSAVDGTVGTVGAVPLDALTV